MKILSIITLYYPHWTGLTAHAVMVAEGLAARGHEVTVLTARHDLALPRDEIINGVRVVRLQPLVRISRGMLMPAFPWAAARLIEQNDVVHIHTPIFEAGLVALLCRVLGRPLVMTHHGDLVMPAGAFNYFVWLGMTAQMILAGKLAGAVTAYSRDYADNSKFLQNFANKLAHIYPPTMIPAPDPAGVQAWRAELGLTGRRLIGFAGRWVEEKGFDYLLRALPLVHTQFPEAQLVYAGECNVVYEHFYEKCRQWIEPQAEYVTFLGLLRDPQKLANFYAMCDVFALPSRTDCLALVQIESLLCGTPVVASDVPGARVVVRETGLGRLTPPHNPGALAQTLIEVLRDRDKYQPTPEKVRAVFDNERTFDQYEGLMARLVRAQRKNG